MKTQDATRRPQTWNFKCVEGDLIPERINILIMK